MKNPPADTPPARGSEQVLVLTNKRSFQQNDAAKESMIATRKKNHGKPFQMRTAPPPFCMSIKTAFIHTDESGKGYLARIKSLRCNSWSCPNCAIKKANKLRYELIEISKLNELDHFLTLTLKPAYIPLAYLEKINRTGYYITYLFNRFLVTLKRKMKRSIKYVWVKEFQQNGNAHLHILFNTFLPIKFLLKEWNRIGGGHSIDIQQTRNFEAAAVYITGYLVKGIKDAPSPSGGFLNGERRYSISHSCIRLTKTKKLRKIEKMEELAGVLSFGQFMQVYNMLQNHDVVDTELLLAPHQESLNL